MKTMKRILILILFIALVLPGHAQDKPNILVIWGDDIG